MACELQSANEGKGGFLRKLGRTYSIWPLFLAQATPFCVCVHPKYLGRGRRKTGVKDPSIKFTSFSFMLTLTQHPAKEIMVWEMKMQSGDIWKRP